MLINNKVKLINIGKQFTNALLAISFFGRSCYERCVEVAICKEKYFKNTRQLY